MELSGVKLELEQLLGGDTGVDVSVGIERYTTVDIGGVIIACIQSASVVAVPVAASVLVVYFAGVMATCVVTIVCATASIRII